MSFSNEIVKQLYNGDGVTTTFAIPFYNLPANPSFIEVYLVDSANAELLTTDYTLTPDQVNPTNVVMTVAPTASQRLLVIRKLPMTQPTAFSNSGPFQKEDYEKALDKITMQMQQLNEKVERAVLHSRGSGYSGKQFPVPTANNILTWDGAGNIINTPVANFTNGTYTGVALAFNTFNLTSGALNLTGSPYSNIYCSGVAAKTITLPTAASAGAGRIFLIFSDGQAAVTTVNRGGSDTIEGSTSFGMTQAYKWAMFVSDGVSMWHHNQLKQQEVTSAMYADSSISAAKTLHTVAAAQSTGFTAANAVGYYPCNTTAGSFTATLPSAVSLSGKIFTFENIGTANVLTIDPNGTQTINGALTRAIYPGESITIVSDAANWRILSFRSLRTINTETAQLTPAASGQWHAFPDNSLILTPGRWQLSGNMNWNSSGGSGGYTEFATAWHGAAGANSSAYTDISTLPGVTVESRVRSGTGFQNYVKLSAAVDSYFLPMPVFILNCTQNVTVYGNANTLMTTAANARLTGLLNATKIGE